MRRLHHFRAHIIEEAGSGTNPARVLFYHQDAGRTHGAAELDMAAHQCRGSDSTIIAWQPLGVARLLGPIADIDILSESTQAPRLREQGN
jgi:hypothetical protein